MPIPDAEIAIVTRDKVGGYLLNVDHPDGGSKALWFHSLGYKRENWRILAKDLLEIARTCDKYDMEHSPYGVKYKVPGTISRPAFPRQ